MKSYYDTLGVAKTATTDEIKKSFRAIAMENHPDRHPGDKAAEARFKEAAEAYEVLSSESRRRDYDRTGDRPIIQAQDYANVAQAFKDLFNGWVPQATSHVFSGPSRDLTVDLELEFREAALGCKKEIRFVRNGAWQAIEIRIPAGLEDGTRLRVQKLGASVGNMIGDLYVNVAIRPDPMFDRDGLDIHTMALVPLTTLVLGGGVAIMSPAGQLDLEIKPGTPADATITVKRCGMQDPTGRQHQGDLHVHLRAVVPSKLSREQRELYTQLAAIDSGDAIPLPKMRRHFR